MSEQPKPTPQEVVNRLKDFTKAVTGDTRDWHEFYLRIPADPRHDSDFIFTEAARLIEAAYINAATPESSE